MLEHVENFRAHAASLRDVVCHYALRPPVARERLSVTGDGRVRLQVRRRWGDVTTHLEWDAVDFLGRLAVSCRGPGSI